MFKVRNLWPCTFIGGTAWHLCTTQLQCDPAILHSRRRYRLGLQQVRLLSPLGHRHEQLPYQQKWKQDTELSSCTVQQDESKRRLEGTVYQVSRTKISVAFPGRLDVALREQVARKGKDFIPPASGASVWLSCPCPGSCFAARQMHSLWLVAAQVRLCC